VVGVVLDVVVDLCVGFLMFGYYEMVLFDDVDCVGVYVSVGFGYVIMVFVDDIVFVYFVFWLFVFGVECLVNLMCFELGIDWLLMGCDGVVFDFVLGDCDWSVLGLYEVMWFGVLFCYEQ